MSVFEVNIRFVGGLLACYALTGDQVYLDHKIMYMDFKFCNCMICGKHSFGSVKFGIILVDYFDLL